MKFGSHLYGLQTKNSDTDYKGVYLPTLNEILLGKVKDSINLNTNKSGNKNTAEDVDEEYYSLHKFVKQAIKGETFAIDMLHCTTPEVTSPIWEHLVNHRKKFYSKNMSAYIGYVKQQAHKYGIKGSRLSELRYAITSLKNDGLCWGLKSSIHHSWLGNSAFTGEFVKWTTRIDKMGNDQIYYEVLGKLYQYTNTYEYVIAQLEKTYNIYGHRAKQAEMNEGVDWKAISHAFRAGYQALDIYTKGDFEYPLQQNEFILKVKTGQLDFNDVSVKLEELVKEVEQAANNSDLPDEVDSEYWEAWLLGVYKQELL